MKKLVLFDWGNIVESHDTGYSCLDAWYKLFRTCGYTGDHVLGPLSKYRLSSIQTEAEFKITYEKIKKEFNLDKNFDEFKNLFKEIFKDIDYYKDVRDYELSLKDKCYIGILSNLNILEKERLDSQVGLSNYDYVFLSFEFGLEKPDIKFFEAVQAKLPFEPSDILFIDDIESNVLSASKLGWNTLKATGLELDKIKEKVSEFLANT